MSLITIDTSSGPITVYENGNMLVSGLLAWELEEEDRRNETSAKQVSGTTHRAAGYLAINEVLAATDTYN